MLNLKFILQILELRHNICRSKWTRNLTSKYSLESLRCLLQLSRRLLPHLRTLRLSYTESKLRGSVWILNSFRSKISILMLLHYFAFQWGPSLYTLKINILNAQNKFVKIKIKIDLTHKIYILHYLFIWLMNSHWRSIWW